MSVPLIVAALIAGWLVCGILGLRLFSILVKFGFFQKPSDRVVPSLIFIFGAPFIAFLLLEVPLVVFSAIVLAILWIGVKIVKTAPMRMLGRAINRSWTRLLSVSGYKNSKSNFITTQ